MSGHWRVEPYEAAKRGDWDAFVEQARAPHFLFLRDYMEYHSDRFEDSSLLVYDGNRLAALLPATRDGDTIRSHGGLTFGGFVTGDRMTAHGMIETFDAMIARLRETGARRLVYAPVPHIYHRVPAEEDVYVLFRLGARLIRRDLSSTIKRGHRLPLSKGRRSSTKRATGEAMTIERSDEFATFMELDAAMLEERYGVTPTHTGAELARLAARFPDSIKLFVARDGPSLLAGVVVYETERVAHAQYIASSDEGRARGAIDAIVAHLLDELYAEKPYFDFGISTERDGAHLNRGLVRNKESYGARGVAYDRYELGL
jgi:hypothetical protein